MASAQPQVLEKDMESLTGVYKVLGGDPSGQDPSKKRRIVRKRGLFFCE